MAEREKMAMEVPPISGASLGVSVAPDASDVGSRLVRLAQLAAQFHSQRVAEESVGLAERLREGRFYVACIGQFKRGKSTLLNALVDDKILPTGVVPITTVPTVLRYGAKREARIRFEAGSWLDIAPCELTQYVSEERNPENAKRVAGVEVFLPSALLADGMCLVDTPGLGSVFAGNTAATQAFVPHIDAAIVVLGADPPIAGEELSLVEEVGRQVRQLLVVLNKADRTSEGERRAAVPFTRGVLEKKLGRPIGPIFEVSAYERSLQNQRNWDWDAFQSELRKLAEESGQMIVRSAGERGLRRLGEELLSVTHEESQALLRPIEESERRIAAMQETIQEAERSLREFGYLFTAEQHHLSDLFLERRKGFLVSTGPTAHEAIQQAFRELPHRYGPRFRRDAMRSAQRVATGIVLPWLAAEQARAEKEYRTVAARFVTIGNEFLQKLAATKIPELARMPNALDSEKGFRVSSKFRFEELIHIAEPASPLRYLADVFLGGIGAWRVLEKEASSFFEYLLEMNSSRVQSDVLDRVEDSRSQLEAEIRKLLYEIKRIASTALDHAKEARAEGAAAVSAKLSAIEEADREIKVLLTGERGANAGGNRNGNGGR
jgi:Dynamin family